MTKMKKNDHTNYGQGCRGAHTLPVESANGTITLKNSLTVSLEIKSIPTVCINYSTPKYFPKEIKTHAHIDLYIGVHISFVTS